MPSPDNEIFLTRIEVAERHGVDPATLARWERAGRVVPIRTVTGHRYRLSEIETALAAERPGEPVAAEEQRPAVPLRRRDARRRSRKRALEALHQADVRGVDARDALAEDDEFARALVEGVSSVRRELDGVIGESSEHWTIDRMPVVDRNVLRIAVYELLHTDTAPGVVIDEAVTLVKMLSTEDSGRFVNGVLGRIARDRARG